MATFGKRVLLDRLFEQMVLERSSFIDQWKEISNHVKPTRARFFITDVNNGERKNQKILNSTATFASRTARAGMMSGITSPARQWFQLRAPDLSLNENFAVKGWLDTVSNRMNDIFLRSNLYTALPAVYGDLLDYGTAAMFVEEDYEEVMRFYPIPIGSYVISTNSKNKVDTFGREFRMTVRQLVEKFGIPDPAKPEDIDWSVFSNQVKNLWENKQPEEWIDIRHVVKPNENFNPRSPLAKHKRYVSYYYERGGSAAFGNSGMMNSSFNDENDDKVLRESGYDFFPVLCPRWEVTGEDSYGTDCPGMTAVGDIKQLQKAERLKLRGIEQQAKPSMVAPESMRNKKSSIVPGDVTYEPDGMQTGGFRRAYDVNWELQYLLQSNQQVEYRIQRAYFEDLFLMISQIDRKQITAREIDVRQEEKLLALGPVLEQLNDDVLDPLIDLAFHFMQRQNLIPEPPQELSGAPLKVEYISIMAQAQKLLGIGSLERFVGFVAQLPAIDPSGSYLAKIDVDQLIDIYADTLSLKVGVVRPDEQVAAIKQAQAQAQAQAAQQEQMNMAAQTQKTLSETNLDGDSALNRLMQQAEAGALV